MVFCNGNKHNAIGVQSQACMVSGSARGTEVDSNPWYFNCEDIGGEMHHLMQNGKQFSPSCKHKEKF